jgi:hypothetical protein
MGPDSEGETLVSTRHSSRQFPLPPYSPRQFPDHPYTFGKIYEYFLGNFAKTEGQKGGELFTPRTATRGAAPDRPERAWSVAPSTRPRPIPSRRRGRCLTVPLAGSS